MNYFSKYQKYKRKYVQLKNQHLMLGGDMNSFFQKNYPNEKIVNINKLDQAGFAKIYAVTAIDSKIPTKTYVIKAAKGYGQDCKKEISILEKLKQGDECNKHILCPIKQSHVTSDSVDPYCYIVTEYLDGYKSLFHFTNEYLTKAHNIPQPYDKMLSSVISVDGMSNIIKILANGLFYIHEKGIIHSDIKPDNIMISLTKGNLKYIDFGLSIDLSIWNKNQPVRFGVYDYYLPPDVRSLAFKKKVENVIVPLWNIKSSLRLLSTEIWAFAITLIEVIVGGTFNTMISQMTSQEIIKYFDAKFAGNIFENIYKTYIRELFTDEYLTRIAAFEKILESAGITKKYSQLQYFSEEYKQLSSIPTILPSTLTENNFGMSQSSSTATSISASSQTSLQKV